MWHADLVIPNDDICVPGLSKFSGLLRELLLLVSPPDRVEQMVASLNGERDWPGVDRLVTTFAAAAVPVSASEMNALNVVESIIDWARDERRATSIGELSVHWRLTLGALAREVVEVALLDPAGRLVPDGIVRVHEGTHDRVVIEPRRVMELALRYGATALVLAHNHPSGKIRPTPRDVSATRRVVLAGATIDVSVVDHLIISSEGILSFSREGLL